MRAPLFVLHGGDDRITDAATTERFVALAGSADKRFARVACTYHEVLKEPDADAVPAEVVDWLHARS